MDKNSLYLAVAEVDLDECIVPSKRRDWTEKWIKDSRHDFRADAKNNFFYRNCRFQDKKHDKREQGCSMRCSDAPKCSACVVNSIAVSIKKVKSIRLL